ncbi:MAG: HAD family phosphatase [Treponema sp.]|jgi:HAD superfamily hydrolase (TIGR01509 family)|nr:HAD family phosphatase [Treponema sp.]
MHTNENSIRPAAVIFDMDGLMLDTERLSIPLWSEAGIEFGYTITEEIVLRMVGISSKKTRELLFDEFGSDFPYDSICEEFRRLVKKKIEENGVPKKYGLDFLLDRLSSAKIPLAVATSTRRVTAVEMLRKADILDKFSAVVCGDDVANGKPAPDIFLLAAEKLGVLPSDCAGFEDSPAGLKGLHSAGIRSIFIKDIIEPPQDVLATVWCRCNNLEEAVKLFNL